jgi:hypothetical protein
MKNILSNINEFVNKFKTRFKFNNKNVSTNCVYSVIEDFKEAINFKGILGKNISYIKDKNSTYQVTEVIDFMVDCIIQGKTRFSHMEDMRKDLVYQNIKNKELPSEKTCRYTIEKAPKEIIDDLRKTSRDLLELKSENEEPREVMINIDDTVVTVFGNQEEAEKGYNPKYKGKKSYKEKVAVIMDTKELIDITLEKGSSNANNNFLTFFQNCEKMLPNKWYLKRVRLDSGMFDEKNFNYFEGKNYEYIVKGKMIHSMHEILGYINENEVDYSWEKAKNAENEFTEIRIPLQSWEKARRMIFVRKKIRIKDKNNVKYPCDDLYEYNHQVIVTNIDYMTCEEIFSDYNQRCDIETKIDELKEGFAFSQNSSKNKDCNTIFLLIKMIAYNVHNWFRQECLPDNIKKCEIKTLRRILYNIPGNLCGHSYYKYISLPNYDYLKNIINCIQLKLNKLLINNQF